MFSKISVIGSGAWGTALATHLASVFPNIYLYGRNSDLIDEVNLYHTNERYLPGVTLPKNIIGVYDITDIIDSDIIFMAVPSKILSSILLAMKYSGLQSQTVLVIATKGMAKNPAKLFSSFLDEALPNNNYAFLVGPNFAMEVAERKYTTATIASKDLYLSKQIAKICSNRYFEFFPSQDIITVQIASIVKNIVAIYSGIITARGDGENARASLITKSLQEIALISSKLGGNIETILEPGVVGDLVLTSYSTTSRNTNFGYHFHLSNYSSEFLRDPKYLVEGVEAAKLVKELLAQYDLDTPIISSVVELCTEHMKFSV